MAAVLTHNSYGKSRVRLTKVERGADRHEIREITVDLRLEGDFAASYTEGDNGQVIATDTMKNLVYALAVGRELGPVERFGAVLVGYLLAEYTDIHLAEARLTEQPWRRIVHNGQDHPHAFVGGGSEVRYATLTQRRGEELKVRSGIEGLLLIKTTGSAFKGFPRDRYTVLPEAEDRILATEVRADWKYATNSSTLDLDAAHRVVRDVMIQAFANHESASIQQTLHILGDAVLDAMEAIDEIHLALPNNHRIPFDVSRFGLDGRDEIFVTTDEPFGLISGTLRRS